MTVVALTSLAGAPGATTAALAFAVHWPRPVVVIEADTSAVSTMMTGFLRSNFPPRAAGIEKLAIASTRGVLHSEDLLDPERELAIPLHQLPALELPVPAIPDSHQMWVIPGFVNLATVDGNVSMWGRLPRILRALSESGIDVIVDIGRLGHEDPRRVLLDTLDHVVVCAESTMTDLNRLYRRLEMADLTGHVTSTGGQSRWSVLLRKPVAQEIPKRDFATHVLPVLEVLPHDPDGAAVFSLGNPDLKPRRNRYRSAIRGAVAKLDQLTSQTALDRKAS